MRWWIVHLDRISIINLKKCPWLITTHDVWRKTKLVHLGHLERVSDDCGLKKDVTMPLKLPKPEDD